MTEAQRNHLQAGRLSYSTCVLIPPYKELPEGMGIWVYAMNFGNGRLCYGEIGDAGYAKGWCYKSCEAAFEAADKWDGQGCPEGWKKDLQTQEYRKEFE